MKKTYNEGWEDGYLAALRAYADRLPVVEEARRAGFAHLEGFCVRWDAATRETVIWDLTGKEKRI